VVVAYWDAALETMPWHEVQSWQAEQLGPFLAALVDRSEFHREVLAGSSIPTVLTDLAPLADLPTTSKDQVRSSQADRAPKRPFGRHQGAPLDDIVQTLSSSGTTGDPVYFALTAQDLQVWNEAIATAFYTAGVRRHDVAAHLVGLPGVAGGLPYADGFRRIGATLAWLGGLSTEKIVRALPKLQASVVLATSSFGTYLADQCQELIGQDASSLGVRNLLGGGEPGLAQPEIRERIRQGWGLDHVHEIMGLGDVLPVLWAECDEGGGMHFCAQRSVVVELIDPLTGELLPWEEGVRGEAVYTTFAREATPALRYRSADHMLVTAASCPCGRTSPRVRCVGRTDDMLIYKAMNVFPSAIRDVVLDGFADDTQPYLRVWKDAADQVRFDAPMAIDVEADPALPESAYGDLARRIEHEVRQRLHVRVAATLVAPGSLPRSAYKTALIHVREPESTT
jgi:phenylacetate-coenzyme A ligase PaaK-like adenylate-forming protein